MSYLTQLNEDSIRNYTRLDTGKGYYLKKEIEYLNVLYTSADHDIFGPDDHSSARECIELLGSKITRLQYLASGLDTQIDNLVKRIETDVLDVEDSVVASVREG